MRFKERQAEREEEEKLLSYKKRFDELTEAKGSRSSRRVEAIQEEDEDEGQREELIDILPQIGEVAEEIMTS